MSILDARIGDTKFTHGAIADNNELRDILAL